MYNNIKPTASLTSSLLARKGQARPAMRPQAGVTSAPQAVVNPGDIDDLGWNDMGGDVPTVVAQRQSLEAQYSVSVDAEAKDGDAANTKPKISSATAARIGREVNARKGAKAAFTLRLDQERHLKLRLATALTGRSAQQLITEAMDEFLATFPELETLIEQLPAGKGRGTERN